MEPNNDERELTVKYRELMSGKRSKGDQILELFCEEAMPPFADSTLLPKILVSRPKGPRRLTATAAAEPSRSKSKRPSVPSHQSKSNRGGRTISAANANSLQATAVATALANCQQQSKPRNQAAVRQPPQDKNSHPVAGRSANTFGDHSAIVRRMSKAIEYLTYDWSDLKLGTETGSASWRQALRQKLKENPHLGQVPQPTALECLEALQSSIRSDTIVLPPIESPLHKVLKKSWMASKPTSLDDDSDEDSVSAQPPMPQERQWWHGILEQTYQEMVTQELEDRSLKREYQFMTCEQVQEKMRSLENESAKLQLREMRVKRTAQQVGLMNASDSEQSAKSKLRRLSQEEELKKTLRKTETAYWQPNFANLLMARKPETVYLVWDDLY